MRERAPAPGWAVVDATWNSLETALFDNKAPGEVELAAGASEPSAYAVHGEIPSSSLLFLVTEDPTSKTRVSANGQQCCCQRVYRGWTFMVYGSSASVCHRKL